MKTLRSWSRTHLLVGACLVAPGRASARETDLGTISQPIVGGTASTSEQNGAVLLVRGEFLRACTGTVVAPRFILTARHCLFGPEPPDDFYRRCEGPERLDVDYAFDATDFTVAIGHMKPLRPEGDARGVEIHTNEALDVCTNDLALLEVDPPLSIDPVPLRLDTGPVLGEEGTLIGWGWLAADNPSLPNARQQRDLRVQTLGPDFYPRSELFVAENGFASAEGGCVGDDGAPLVSKATNAVFGMAQAVVNPNDPPTDDDPVRYCFGGITIFQRLDVQAGWLRSTLHRHGAAPWIEGKKRPAALLEPCDDPEACISGTCVDAGAESFCSVRCDDQPCPGGMTCIGRAGERVCSADDPVHLAAVSAACAVARNPRDTLMASLAIAAALLCLGARRGQRGNTF